LITKTGVAVILSMSLVFSSGCSALSKFAKVFEAYSSENVVSDDDENDKDDKEETTEDKSDKKGRSPDKVKYYGDEDLPTLQQIDFSMFASSALSDTVSLNYYLRDPMALNLSMDEVTLGDVSQDTVAEQYDAFRAYLDLLDTVSFDDLTDEEKIMYEVLQYDLEEALLFEDYQYYSSSFNSLTGIQSNLPLIMCEYIFDEEKDAEEYILLMKDFYRYYKDLMDFEKERAEQGFSPSDENIEKIIDSCESFLENKDEHFMITSFNERVDQLDGITDDKKESLKEENKAAMDEYVFPAYELLIDEFTDLLGTGKNDGGLCNFENGKEYYDILLKADTSTQLSPDEAADLLDDVIDEQIELVLSINYDDIEDAYNSYDFSKGSTEENLAYCKKFVGKDFPDIMEHDVTLKQVPEQLEDFFSPAAYLTCAIDDPTSNVILTNESQLSNYPNLLDTIAHEGYPGHLYEAVYHAQYTKSYYQRSATFTGYSEGWAQYAAAYVLKNSEDYDPTLVSYVYAEDMIFNLYIPSRIDIGVNYEGWSREDVYEYLNSYGLDDQNYGDGCYDIAVEIPCYYLPYSIGKKETDRIMSELFSELDGTASPLEIHEAYLAAGPGPFSIVEKYADAYAESVKN
jgi:uncharacterized protein (DUF885 family)